jgi:thiamine-monophosphate kinase
MLTAGVDFLLEQVDPQLVGRKALGVNLSDLAAMAAVPVAAFVSLVLPKRGTSKLSALELAIQLYLGMAPLAARYGITIAGGDTNTWDGPLAINITAIGQTTAHGPLTRSAAQVGDQILVTGSLGGSILGKHLEFEARVAEALLLHDRYALHAGMDISDGLALELDLIPISDAACHICRLDGGDPIQCALSDGEDFELLLAVPPDAARDILSVQPLEIPVTRIGEVVAEPGLWQVSSDGSRGHLAARGFEHRAHE